MKLVPLDSPRVVDSSGTKFVVYVCLYVSQSEI